MTKKMEEYIIAEKEGSDKDAFLLVALCTTFALALGGVFYLNKKFGLLEELKMLKNSKVFQDEVAKVTKGKGVKVKSKKKESKKARK